MPQSVPYTPGSGASATIFTPAAAGSPDTAAISTQGVGYTPFTSSNLGAGVNVKSSAGQLASLHVYNNSSGIRYVKLYNKATAPTVGTDTPIWTVPLEPLKGSNIPIPTNLSFTSGIGIGASRNAASTDATVPLTNDIIVNIAYA